ncbi:MAG: aldo/keto reductase [Clostridia bacterium]|nr:aldo/keto reductase [Clostridia bacterium]
MRYRDFGGKRAAVIAFGTMDFGGKIGAEQSFELMDAYAGLGGNFLDTARVYGDMAGRKPGGSEKVIGRWLSGQDRDAFVLSTKGGHPDLDHMDVGRLSRAEITDDLSRSLDDLRTDYVDIYWLHRDDRGRDVGDIAETLNALLETGRVRMIGVSNWTPARIRAFNAYAAAHGLHGIDANQPRFSLARQVLVEDPTLCAMDAETYRMHMETGMPAVPFSSQAKGFFSKLFELGEAGLSEKARRRYYAPENLEIYRRVLALREETGLSVGAIALAYLTCQPFPTFPLAGASRISQVLALAEAGDAVITDAQRDALRSF